MRRTVLKIRLLERAFAYLPAICLLESRIFWQSSINRESIRVSNQMRVLISPQRRDGKKALKRPLKRRGLVYQNAVLIDDNPIGSPLENFQRFFEFRG